MVLEDPFKATSNCQLAIGDLTALSSLRFSDIKMKEAIPGARDRLFIFLDQDKRESLAQEASALSSIL
jgi:hypothetical protein